MAFRLRSGLGITKVLAYGTAVTVEPA